MTSRTLHVLHGICTLLTTPAGTPHSSTHLSTHAAPSSHIWYCTHCNSGVVHPMLVALAAVAHLYEVEAAGTDDGSSHQVTVDHWLLDRLKDIASNLRQEARTEESGGGG